jgi:hypothetical protein
MGLKDIQQLEKMACSFPYYPINYDLKNEIYLIIHDRNNSKNAHMSVLVDLSGQSVTEL